MPTFVVANITHENRDAVVVFLPPDASQLGSDSRIQLRDALEKAAKAEGLSGDVLAVWEHEGSLRYMAPEDWFDYLQNTTLSDLSKQISGRIIC